MSTGLLGTSIIIPEVCLHVIKAASEEIKLRKEKTNKQKKQTTTSNTFLGHCNGRYLARCWKYTVSVNLLSRSSMWTCPADIGGTSIELRRLAAGCTLGFYVEIRVGDFQGSTSKLPLPSSWPLFLLSYEDETIFFLRPSLLTSKPWECSVTTRV